MVAAETNRPEVCDYLIDAGADVNLYDATGKMSLQFYFRYSVFLIITTQ